MKYSTLSTLLAIAATTVIASPIDSLDPFLLEQVIEHSLAKRNAEAIGDNHVNFDKTPSLIEPWWNFPHLIIGNQKVSNKRSLKSIMQEDNFLDGPGVAPWHRNMGCPEGSIWSTEDLACTSPQNQKKKRDTLAKRNFLPKPTIGHPEWWRNIPPIPVDHLKGINTINKIKKRNAEQQQQQQQQQQRRQTSDRPVVLEGWNPSLQISDETLKILFPDHPRLNRNDEQQRQQQQKRQTSNLPLPGTWNQNLQIPDETFKILFPNAIRAGPLQQQQQKEQKNRRATIVGIEQLFSKAHISPESWDRIFANSKIHPQEQNGRGEA